MSESTASSRIGRSIELARSYLTAHPGEARHTDSAASAMVEDGLRCRVEGPDGAVLYTDVPAGIGGASTAPTPGWYARAAHSSCEATLINMRAAELGIPLRRVEVVEDGESDDRGILALDDQMPAGPLRSRTRVRVTAPGIDPQLLRDLVEWADRHSPVSDAVRRAVPMTIEVETVEMELS
ncbi:MAG: OsmC family protein [Micromonosporaceae bacterium]